MARRNWARFWNKALLNEQINIITPPGVTIPADKFFNVIESILRMKGLAIVSTDTALKLVRTTEVKENPMMVRSAEDIENLGFNDQIVTQIIPLKYIDATTVSTMLMSLKSKDATFIPSADANMLIVTEYASNIRRLYEVVKQIDQETQPYQTEVRTLRYANAQAVRAALNEYIQIMTSTTKPRPGIPIPRPFASIDERTNSVIIFALEKDMKQVLKIIDMLDGEAKSKDTNIYTYKLINTNAEEVAKIIESIFAKQVAGIPATARRPQEIMTVMSEKSTNSLIIIAPPAVYEEMVELIKKIDIKKEQVLIEAAIVELSTDKLRDLGIELAGVGEFHYKDPDKQAGYAGGTEFGLSTRTTTGGRVPIPPKAGGLTVGLWKDSVDSIPFLLQASQKDTDIDVKATPRLLTNDNAEATFNITDEIPYDTRTIGPDGTVTGITFGGFLVAGTKLKIIPHISADDYLRLEIEQEVGEFVESSYSTERPGKTTRTLKTVVTVPDRDTVVIGGLTKEYKTQAVSKIPLLGDIPILGALFSRTKDVTIKKNLWIFIKPHIMRQLSDLFEKTKEERKLMEGLKEDKDNKK
ncbi:MAG: type II secretion system secretin GspD [Planctomycetes bacterium]|nr:type II secretion system secretin GspD [Planctomycetota bacterium]